MIGKVEVLAYLIKTESQTDVFLNEGAANLVFHRLSDNGTFVEKIPLIAGDNITTLTQRITELETAIKKAIELINGHKDARDLLTSALTTNSKGE